MVVLTDMFMSDAEVLNEKLRAKNVKSMLSCVYGVCGVVFADFLDNNYLMNPVRMQDNVRK